MTVLPPDADCPPGSPCVPVVDLTAVLEDLGARSLRLRSQAARWRSNAAVMVRQADQLAAEADYLHQLAETLRGGPRAHQS